MGDAISGILLVDLSTKPNPKPSQMPLHPPQAVGDAISGILLVEVALRRRGWGLSDWAALYADLPSRQSKVTGVAPLKGMAGSSTGKRPESDAGCCVDPSQCRWLGHPADAAAVALVHVGDGIPAAPCPEADLMVGLRRNTADM